MKPLAHREIEELLGAYALNAVDSDEAMIVEQHLEGCPRCRSEVAGHREVATVLGNTGGDAPAGLWDRISLELDDVPPPMRLGLIGGSASVTPLAPRRRVPQRFVMAAVGAAAALAIGGLGVQVLRQQDELDRVRVAVEDGSLLSAANVALRDPSASTVHLRSTDGLVTATAVVLSDGTGYLLAQDLPGLAEDRTYQLWGETDAGLISLGLLGGDPSAIVPFSVGQKVDALAVTAEDAGGVVQSDNPAVVAGTLS